MRTQRKAIFCFVLFFTQFMGAFVFFGSYYRPYLSYKNKILAFHLSVGPWSASYPKITPKCVKIERSMTILRPWQLLGWPSSYYLDLEPVRWGPSTIKPFRNLTNWSHIYSLYIYSEYISGPTDPTLLVLVRNTASCCFCGLWYEQVRSDSYVPWKRTDMLLWLLLSISMRLTAFV